MLAAVIGLSPVIIIGLMFTDLNYSIAALVSSFSPFSKI
jgi:hypothetical protein